MDRLAVRIARADPAFREVVEANPPMRLETPTDTPFQAMLESIVFQQLAGAAASAIHRRVIALFDGGFATPEGLPAIPVERLRGAGLSASKVAAISDLAAKFLDGTVPTHDLESLSDDDIVARLVQVRGVGRWTAEMFLMFQLRRPDVWPVDDLGVRNGWSRIHGLATPPKPKELTALGDVFRPYRSAAAWYCWRAVKPLSRTGRA